MRRKNLGTMKARAVMYNEQANMITTLLGMNEHRFVVHYLLNDATFRLALSEPCKGIGIDMEEEKQRSLIQFGPLGVVECYGSNGNIWLEPLLPVRLIPKWLASVATPPRADGKRYLAICRERLYRELWPALSRVDCPGGRVKWSEFSCPDADGEVFSEEQVAADMGIPPEKVSQSLWRLGVFGKKGFGKWVSRTSQGDAESTE